MTKSKIGERLRKARDEADLTQEQAATLLGVSSMTVSKRERGVLGISAEEFERVLAVYQENGRYGRQIRLGQIVPRRTVGEPGVSRYEADMHWLNVEEADASPQLRGRYERLVSFERKMIRDGATDEEANYIRARGLAFLRSMSPEEYLGDNDDKSIGEAMLDVEFNNYLEHVVGPVVAERIEARAIQPIKPEDVPAAVEKRRAELEADSKKRKAK